MPNNELAICLNIVLSAFFVKMSYLIQLKKKALAPLFLSYDRRES